jgi:hypothetical protein
MHSHVVYKDKLKNLDDGAEQCKTDCCEDPLGRHCSSLGFARLTW